VTAITIDERFCGPSTSGHGGYTSGRLAAFLDTPASVRLHLPPPLRTPLEVVSQYYGGVDLTAGDEVVATAERRAPLSVDPPDPVEVEVAAECEHGYLWIEDHPFPRCFACGTERAVGDGWRIFAGPTPDGEFVASRAVCPQDLAVDGLVPVEQIWAALDCTTAGALSVAGADRSRPWVLGTYAVDVWGRFPAESTAVAMAWPVELEGRKFFAEGALYVEGRAVAVATATWIQLREGLAVT
jgi:hypothetical protein